MKRFKLNHSLLTQYVLIVLCALVLLPFSFPLVSVIMYVPQFLSGGGDVRNGTYNDGLKLERMWHEEAGKLQGADEETIEGHLSELKAKYPLASMYRVDADGVLQAALPENPKLPAQWTPTYTVQFMKARSGGDPFTVVALLGDEKDEGFIVFELPRNVMRTSDGGVSNNFGFIFVGGFLLILALFLFLSFMFFYRIRRRLVRLQTAMTGPPAENGSGIPAQVEVLASDEIGRLEQSFNAMIGKLEASRAREAEEEVLRRELIAKLSHDLRTPLTTIRGHAYSLRSESLSERGQESIALIERKTGYLGQMIENLFSYSLLSAGKYPYRPKQVEIVRMTRTFFAGWYPAFEQEGFEIDLNLPEEGFMWVVDSEWLERVLDNYCQNVLRHAKSGRYVGLTVDAAGGGRIVLSDRGEGMGSSTLEKGAGLGLSIASLMLKEMGLRGDVATGPAGTVITISQRVFGTK
ncbi:signal transduction histidine kinase [Paenibacillus phyllosphaerae]|uniref:histidine kinase n=1 Tax=Paenibacillus phyllosphaerae TaxID=274593 RepID=A0A7W5AXJ0_9BACL|nr:HAMP domain-containing sensor histidine kinase [Paenibacillus phyllosphaerae]MBB3110613.1 signal transduction histidine kinase [Paenibacillus phyllosphaerae]